MRSTMFSLRLPVVILDAVKKRAKQLGYQSLTAYIVGLIRYDLMIGKDHPATVEIARQREEDQDAIDDELVRMYEKGESLKGQYFENTIRDAVKSLAEGKEIAKTKITEELLRRVRSRKKEK